MMSKEIFYLAKNNINGGIGVYRSPPEKLMRIRDANVCWDGEREIQFYQIERFLSLLKQPPGSCMMVGVITEGDGVMIRVLDRDVECVTSYY